MIVHELITFGLYVAHGICATFCQSHQLRASFLLEGKVEHTSNLTRLPMNGFKGSLVRSMPYSHKPPYYGETLLINHALELIPA